MVGGGDRSVVLAAEDQRLREEVTFKICDKRRCWLPDRGNARVWEPSLSQSKELAVRPGRHRRLAGGEVGEEGEPSLSRGPRAVLEGHVQGIVFGEDRKPGVSTPGWGRLRWNAQGMQSRVLGHGHIWSW